MRFYLANVTATLLLVTCFLGCAPWAYRVRPAHLHLPPDGQPALVVPVGEPRRPIEVEWAMSSLGRKLRLDAPADLAALRAEVARNPDTRVALMRRITWRDHAGLLGCGLVLWPGEAAIVPAVELAVPATADRG